MAILWDSSQHFHIECNSTNRAAFGGSPCPLYYIVVVGQTENLGIDILTWLFKTRSKTKVWPLIERRASALIDCML